MYICIFFFQAEDGIRDIGVTGVQTCALPISAWNAAAAGSQAGIVDETIDIAPFRGALRSGANVLAVHGLNAGAARSEERRVGEECRFRWSPDHLKKKT